MKGFTYIYSKQQENVSFLNKIEKIFANYLNKDVKVVGNQHGAHYLYNYTNEDYNFIDHERFFFGLSGYTLDTTEKVFNEIIIQTDKDKYVADLAGVYSLALYEKQHAFFSVWNNITRIEPVYYCETDKLIVIGTKALIVHLIGLQIEKPEYEISSFTSFLNSGYYSDEETPFKGVNVLETNSKITVDNGIMNINQIDDYFKRIYSVDPDQSFYEQLTDTFVDSFSMLKRHKNDYTMGLTGGKDSRLIVAAMKEMGLNISSSTTGFDDTADVIVAKRIAEALQIDHKVSYPGANHSSAVEVDIRSRTVAAIQNSEGMLYSYENISTVGNTFNPNKVHLGGEGGELLRGGYAPNVHFQTRQDLLNYLKKTLTRYQGFMEETAINDYYLFLDDYITAHEHLNYNDIINKFYLDYRSGRWSATARSVFNAGFYSYAPFFDSRLVRKAQLAKTSYGTTEQLIYNILQRLAPELINVPFAEDRWEFEKQGPYSKYDLENWMKRKPIYSKSVKGSFNWRRNVLDNLSDEFRETILSADSPLFNIIHKDKVENLFNTEQKQSYRFDNLLWSLYTATELTSNRWLHGKLDEKMESIAIPSDSNAIKEKRAPKVQILPAKAVLPVHKKIKVSHAIGETSIIAWENVTEDDRLYFKTFNNNFSTPPKDFQEIANVEDATTINMTFHIGKHTVDIFSLEFHLIQYDKKEKVAQRTTTFKIKNKNDMYKLTMKKDPKTKFFRLAIKIKESPESGSFEMYNVIIETI